MKPESSWPLGRRDRPATPVLGEIPPRADEAVDPAVLARTVRKIRMTWAAAMYLLAAECAWIVSRYLPAEYDDTWPRSAWVAGAALLGTALTLWGWMKPTFLEAAATRASRIVRWVGVPVGIIVMVATSDDHRATKYYYRINFRQLAAAIDQFRLENPHRIFINHADIIGPRAYLKAMVPAFGEDYREAFPLLSEAKILAVSCADGRKIVMFLDDLGLVVLGKHGRPLARYDATGGVRKWSETMSQRDGVRVAELGGGRAEITYRDGIPTGAFQVRAGDGRLLAEGTFESGRLVGPCWRYFRDGSRWDETTPEPGQVAEEKLQAREFKAAITEFNRAIELEPTARNFGGRGDANWRLGNLDAAISDYRLAGEARVTGEVPPEYKRSLTEKLNRANAERNKQRPARPK